MLFSVIIPARNEEKHLPRSLKALKEALANFQKDHWEIIVVINRCDDRTEEIARSEQCVIVSCDEKNLAAIRNTGARAAQGDILITIDADSVASPNLLTEIHRKLSDDRVIGGGVVIYPERWSLGIFLTALCLLPIALRYGISAGVFFCRREDFFRIGGFNEAFASVEDIDFARRLKAEGKKTGRKFVTLFRASITTSMRKFDTFGDWYFLRHPGVFLKLLHGNDQKLANKVWYDYKE